MVNCVPQSLTAGNSQAESEIVVEVKSFFVNFTTLPIIFLPQMRTYKHAKSESLEISLSCKTDAYNCIILV